MSNSIGQLNWVPPAVVLPYLSVNPADLPGCIRRSAVVLIQDVRGDYRTAYTEQYQCDDDDDEPVVWRETGRDGYDIDDEDIARWSYIT